jgi:putative DNA primase/helicase
MVELSKSEVSIDQADLDGDDFLLCCSNGTVDLRTGELLPFSRDHHITRQANAKYDVNAPTPNRWLRFIEEIMDGRADLITYLQRCIGYSLCGVNDEQIFFILHGTGANGKTTLVDTILKICNSYSLTTQPDTILMNYKSGSGPSPELAELAGIRFLSCQETQENRRMNESLVKQLTGGDEVSARHLHQEFFRYRPKFKMWISTNHLPRIQDQSFALWRRVRKIPFDVQFTDDQCDPQLKEKLWQERDGILLWAIQGFLDWQEHGMEEPPEVVAATERYRADEDILQDFLEECTREGGIDTSKGRLYKIYQGWCLDSGEKTWSKTALGKRLIERGWKEKKMRNARLWVNVGITPDWISRGTTKKKDEV